MKFLILSNLIFAISVNTPASWIKLNATMLSPIRFNSSGRPIVSTKCFLTSPIKYFSLSFSAKAESALAAPIFDVNMIIVSAKETVSPLPSVKRPSSRIWRNLSRILVCAFSISSNNSTQNGFSFTAFVNCPPAS